MKGKILMAIGAIWCLFILWNMSIGFAFIQLFWLGLGVFAIYKGRQIDKRKKTRG